MTRKHLAAKAYAKYNSTMKEIIGFRFYHYNTINFLTMFWNSESGFLSVCGSGPFNIEVREYYNEGILAFTIPSIFIKWILPWRKQQYIPTMEVVTRDRMEYQLFSPKLTSGCVYPLCQDSWDRRKRRELANGKNKDQIRKCFLKSECNLYFNIITR